MLTALVAMIGLGIAFAQWWLAERRLKMDLFDRRWAIYAAFHDTLGIILLKAKIEPDEYHTFMLATRGTKWLFDENVHKLVDEFVDKINEIDTDTFIIEGNNNFSETLAAQKRRSDFLKEITSRMRQADILFGPYMHIDESFLKWARRKIISLFHDPAKQA